MTEVMIMPNVPRLLETLHHVRTDPDSWGQNTWRCGSLACFAGHAAILGGARWMMPHATVEDEAVEIPEGAVRINRDNEEVVGDGYAYQSDVTYVRADGVQVVQFVAYYAQQHLGLSLRMAEALFSGDNTLPQLELLVSSLTSANPPVNLF